MNSARPRVRWVPPIPRVPASDPCRLLTLSRLSGYLDPGPIAMCPPTVRASMLLKQVRAQRWSYYMAFPPTGGLGETN